MSAARMSSLIESSRASLAAMAIGWPVVLYVSACRFCCGTWARTIRPLPGEVGLQGRDREGHRVPVVDGLRGGERHTPDPARRARAVPHLHVRDDGGGAGDRGRPEVDDGRVVHPPPARA